METTGVGLIGFGTVGSGVAEILLTERDAIAKRAGVRLELKAIADKDVRSRRPVKVGRGLLTTKVDRILDDPTIGIVIELVGGVEPARTFILRALERGKDVVTANKALLALHGAELCAKAAEAGVSLSFEASCAGGIPIIAALRDSFVANRIESICGILNGTANYILTRITQGGIDYATALAEAQALGYAEADPTLDVEGIDSAHKIAILARLGFGADFAFDRVSVSGISGIDAMDIRYADEFGYTVKLLAVAKRHARDVELRVHPTLLPRSHPLASVNESFNGVCVTGHAVGDTMLYGRGAGRMPTASAVVADVVDAALGRARTTFSHFAALSGRVRSSRIRSADRVETRFYLRFTVIDTPGVLARIAGILAKQKISIASVVQKEAEEGKPVPVVMMTHDATEGRMWRALREVDRLAVVKAPTVALRVEG